jgi:hypothetical protein
VLARLREEMADPVKVRLNKEISQSKELGRGLSEIVSTF